MDIDPVYEQSIVPYQGTVPNSGGTLDLSVRQRVRSEYQRGRARSRLNEARRNRMLVAYGDIPDNFRRMYELPPGHRYSDQVRSFERMADDWRDIRQDSEAIASMPPEAMDVDQVVDTDVDMGPGSRTTVYGMREGGKMRRLDDSLAAGAIANDVEEFDRDGSNYDTLVRMIEDYNDDSLIQVRPNNIGAAWSIQTPNGAQIEGAHIPGIYDPGRGDDQFPTVTDDAPVPQPAQPAPQPTDTATLTPVTTGGDSGSGSNPDAKQQYTVDAPDRSKKRTSSFARRLLLSIFGQSSSGSSASSMANKGTGRGHAVKKK